MAWGSIHKDLQQTIQHFFRKCGITVLVAIDGSEDDQINIHGYQVPKSVDFSNTEDHPTAPSIYSPHQQVFVKQTPERGKDTVSGERAAMRRA